MASNTCFTANDCSNKYLVISIFLRVFILVLSFFVQNIQAQEALHSGQDYIQPEIAEDRINRALNYTPGKKVHIIYLVPLDSVENPSYTLSLENAARHLQLWYRDQLGENRTFRLSDPVVEIYKTPHIANWYSTNPNGTLFVQFWNNVLQDGFNLTGGRFYDPNNIWIFYVDAFNACGQCGGCGGGGVAVIGANDLRGLVGLPWIPICPGEGRNYSSCRYIGGLGHELGHAFGVPHPPGCDPYTSSCDDNSIMWTGYTFYPYCYFSENEKNILVNSPFISPQDICDCEFSCKDLITKYYFKTTNKVYYCYGDSVFLGGEYRKKPGIYIDSLFTVRGCDSIIENQLIIAKRYGMYTERTICEGEKILICDNYRTEPGTYIDSFKTIHGCDSIHYTTLFVNPSYYKNNTYEICKGDTLCIGDQPICHAGTYCDSFTTMKGCDSIVISDVIVHPVYEHDFEHEICENDSIYLAGKYRKDPGRYTDSLKSACGCDSIAIHKLRVHPVYNSHLNYEICEGESMILGGEKRITTGVYYDTLMTEYGCEHIVESELIVYENPEIDLGEDTVISTLDTLILDAGPGFLAYYWNIGATGQSIEVYNSQPASYEIIAEVTDYNYCKNADTLSVVIVSEDGIIQMPGDDFQVFPNPADEYIVIQFTDPLHNEGNLVIYLIDMPGRKHHIKAIDNQSNNTLYLKTKDLKQGIYTLCIENGGRTYNCKISIVRM
jgi:hypothetical protein